MDEVDGQPAEADRPHLWNPNAAANWSLLFTPAFGAILHAANWRALGKPERAAGNTVWAGATVAFLAVNIATLFLPDSKLTDGVMRAAGVSLLLGWYFTEGRSQAQFVKDTLRNNYVKRGWAVPLLYGAAAFGAYLTLIFVLALATYTDSQ